MKQGRSYQQTIHDLQAALREVQESQKKASQAPQEDPGLPTGEPQPEARRAASGQLQMARSRSWQDMQAEMASSLQTRTSLQGELASLQTEHSALQVSLNSSLGTLVEYQEPCQSLPAKG